MAIGEGGGNLVPPAVTEAAGLDFGIRGYGSGARRGAQGRIEGPASAAGVGKKGNQIPFIVVRDAPRRIRPGDMARTRSVAGLAGDVDLRPGRVIAVGGEVEVALQIRRVAVGAHEIPGLVHS